MSGEHKQQAALERQRQEQVFVANVGREPSPDAVDDRGMTDLHHAAKLNLPALTIYLLGAGAAVDTEDDLGQTPLCYAEMAAVDAKNNRGETPLHYAAECDASAMAEELLRQGAAVNVRDSFGYTPLYVAMEYNASATAEVLRRYGGRQ